jgi:hypothetical protein
MNTRSASSRDPAATGNQADHADDEGTLPPNDERAPPRPPAPIVETEGEATTGQSPGVASPSHNERQRLLRERIKELEIEALEQRVETLQRENQARRTCGVIPPSSDETTTSAYALNNHHHDASSHMDSHAGDHASNDATDPDIENQTNPHVAQLIERGMLKPPPMLKMDKPFNGKNIAEYNSFMSHLQTVFGHYRQWYSHFPNRVAAGHQGLSDPRRQEWQAHEARFYPKELRWKDFQDWCQKLVDDPKNLYKQAYQKYEEARQLKHQTVREFATYLDALHRQLEEPIPLSHRMRQLHAKVVLDIREEAEKYSEKPETYDGLIGHLQTVEDNMRSRKSEIRKPIGLQDRISTPWSSDRTTSSSSHLNDKRRGPFRGSNHGSTKRKRDSKDSKDSGDLKGSEKRDLSHIKCYSCDEMGHYASSCPNKDDDDKDNKKSKN